MNGLYNMLLGLVVAGLVFHLIVKLNSGLFLSAIVLLVVLAGADALLYRLLMTKGET